MKVKPKRIHSQVGYEKAICDVDAGRTQMQTVWNEYCRTLTTRQLARIYRYRGGLVDMLPIDMLLSVMEELMQRRGISFEEIYNPLVPAKITPSPGGRECLANGSWPGYIEMCADCDFAETVCFPDEN